MSRRRQAKKRKIEPDSKYNSVLVAKFINRMMQDGKKSVSEKIFHHAVEKLEKDAKKPAIEALSEVFENVKPKVEVRSRRVGGSTYQIPFDVSEKRATALAIRWLVEYSRDRHEKTMQERLANELIEAFNNKGGAVKKRDDIHKMAKANRAFAHYRW